MGGMGNRRILLSYDVARKIADERGVSIALVWEALKGLSDIITRDEASIVDIGNVYFDVERKKVIVHVRSYVCNQNANQGDNNGNNQCNEGGNLGNEGGNLGNEGGNWGGEGDNQDFMWGWG